MDNIIEKILTIKANEVSINNNVINLKYSNGLIKIYSNISVMIGAIYYKVEVFNNDNNLICDYIIKNKSKNYKNIKDIYNFFKEYILEEIF